MRLTSLAAFLFNLVVSGFMKDFFYLKQYVERSRNALIITDRNLKVLVYNDKVNAFRSKLLLSEQLTGMSFLDLVKKQHMESVKKLHKICLNTQKRQPSPDIDIKDVLENDVEVSFVPITEETGNSVEAILIELNMIKKSPGEFRVIKDQVIEYETMFNGSSDAIFLVKVESENHFRFVTINRTHSELTGFSPEFIRDKSPQELLGDELGKKISKNYQKCLLKRKTQIYEETLDLPAGIKTWLTSLTPVILDEEVKFLVGSSKDISQQKELEEGLKKKDELLQKISVNVPGVIYQYRLFPDGKSEFPFSTDRITEIYGVTKEEIENDASKVFERIHPEDRKQVTDSIWESFHKLTPWKKDYRVQLPDRGERWLHGEAIPEKMDDNSVLWHGFISDITEQKKVESDLLRLNLAVESSANSVIMTDIKGEVKFFNKAFEIMTGYSKEEVYGKNLKHFIKSGEHSQEFYQQLWSTILSGKTWKGQIINKKKNGQLYREEMTITPFEDVFEGRKYFLAVKEDITLRKQIEDKIKQKTEELEQFFDVSLDMLCIANLKGYFVRVNKIWEEVLGYPIEKLESSEFIQFIHPDDIEKTNDAMDKLTKGDKVVNFVNRFLTSTGEVRYLEWRSSSAGELIYAAARDITERKSYEEALKDSERRFRDVLFSAGEYVWEIDKEGRYTFVSDRVEDTLGRPIRYILSKTPFDFMPEEEKQRSRIFLQKTSKDQVSFKNFEHKSLLPNGEIIWQRVAGSPLYDKVGNFAGFRGTGLDVTQEKTALEALRESELKLRQITESIDEVFWLRSLDNSSILYISPAYEKIWGRSIESLYNDPDSFTDSIHVKDRNRVLKQFRNYLKTGIFESEYRIVRPDGEIRWVIARSNAVKNEEGQTIRHAGTAQDITEKVKIRQQLNDSLTKTKKAYQELKDTQNRLIKLEKKNAVLAMAITANHEVNQPLTIIKGNLEILHSKVEQESNKKYFLRIEESIQRIENLLKIFRNIDDVKMTDYTEGTSMIDIKEE